MNKQIENIDAAHPWLVSKTTTVTVFKVSYSENTTGWFSFSMSLL